MYVLLRDTGFLFKPQGEEMKELILTPPQCKLYVLLVGEGFNMSFTLLWEMEYKDELDDVNSPLYNEYKRQLERQVRQHLPFRLWSPLDTVDYLILTIAS